MNPLDLVFFKGNDFISRTVSGIEIVGTGSNQFTHVGIIINDELLDIPQLVSGELYLLESTVDQAGSGDIVTGRKIGVQIRHLTEVVNSYKAEPNCSVAWCKLTGNPIFSNKVETIAKFKKLYKKYGNAFYNMNILDLLAAAIPCFEKPRNLFDTITHETKEIINNFHHFDTEQWVFCSQLVAIIYKDLGLLTGNPEDFSPVELLSLPCLSPAMNL